MKNTQKKRIPERNMLALKTLLLQRLLLKMYYQLAGNFGSFLYAFRLACVIQICNLIISFEELETIFWFNDFLN